MAKVTEYLYPLEKEKIFRFYCGAHNQLDVLNLGNTIVGYSDELTVPLVDYYHSFELENLERIRRLYYE